MIVRSILVVTLGGAAGSVARYLLSSVVRGTVLTSGRLEKKTTKNKNNDEKNHKLTAHGGAFSRGNGLRHVMRQP